MPAAQLNVNTLSSHYNKVTGKFEKATYHVEDKLRKLKDEEEAEERERKRREEEVSRHMREVEIEHEKDRVAKEQLKEKIRLDALEREADKRYTGPDQDSVARPVSRFEHAHTRSAIDPVDRCHAPSRTWAAVSRH